MASRQLRLELEQRGDGSVDRFFVAPAILLEEAHAVTLRAYLRDMARDPEWRLLKRLCRRAFPAPFPHEDHVSVHLRAGDRNAFATANVTRCVDGHLRGGADRTVFVVAVLHFGENDRTGKYFSTPAQIRDGRALVLETIGALRDRGCAVELQSNRSVDYDLCSLERSKHVCLSKGGLDHVVQRLRKLDAG